MIAITHWISVDKAKIRIQTQTCLFCTNMSFPYSFFFIIYITCFFFIYLKYFFRSSYWNQHYQYAILVGEMTKDFLFMITKSKTFYCMIFCLKKSCDEQSNKLWKFVKYLVDCVYMACLGWNTSFLFSDLDKFQTIKSMQTYLIFFLVVTISRVNPLYLQGRLQTDQVRVKILFTAMA